MKIRHLNNKQELYDWLNFLSRKFGKTHLSKFEKRFLGEVRVGVLYGCEMLVVEDLGSEEENKICSLLSYTVTGGYLNIYFILTHPNMRGAGLSQLLIQEATRLHRNEVVRHYVKASSVQSVSLFSNNEYKCFGKDKTGVLVFEKDIKALDMKRKAEKVCVDFNGKVKLWDYKLEALRSEPYNCDDKQLLKYKILPF